MQTLPHLAPYSPLEAGDYEDPGVRAAGNQANNELDEFDRLKLELDLDYNETMIQDPEPPVDTVQEPIPKVQIRRITGPEPAEGTAPLTTPRKKEGKGRTRRLTSRQNATGRRRA